MSERGVRLHIDPATLREWRHEFARRLREQGISGNATERAVRGETRTHKTDGVYRAALRGESTHTRQRIESAADDLRGGHPSPGAGNSKLFETRRAIERGWRSITAALINQGRPDLAKQVLRFVE